MSHAAVLRLCRELPEWSYQVWGSDPRDLRRSVLCSIGAGGGGSFELVLSPVCVPTEIRAGAMMFALIRDSRADSDVRAARASEAARRTYRGRGETA